MSVQYGEQTLSDLINDVDHVLEQARADLARVTERADRYAAALDEIATKDDHADCHGIVARALFPPKP